MACHNIYTVFYILPLPVAKVSCSACVCGHMVDGVSVTAAA